MPQLEINTFPTQIFWLLVFFSVFTYLMWNYIVPHLKEPIEARQKHFSALETKLNNDLQSIEEISSETRTKLLQNNTRTNMRLKEMTGRITGRLANERVRLNSEYKAKIRNSFKEIHDNVNTVEQEIMKEDFQDLVQLAYDRIMRDAK